MTTLKAINKTIEEGNDDLEELNTNFKKWFELQKRNRLDDLEAAREAKRAMKGIGAGAITGTGGSGGSGSGDDSESDSKIPGILKSILGTLVAGSVIKRIFKGPKTKTTPKTNAPKTNVIIEKLQAKLDAFRIKNLKLQIAEATAINEAARNAKNMRIRNATLAKYGGRFNQGIIDQVNRTNLLNRSPYGPDSGKGDPLKRVSRFNQLKIDTSINKANLLKRIPYGVGSGEAAKLSGLKFGPGMESPRATSRNTGLFTQGIGSGVADPFRVRPTNTGMRMSRPATVTSSTGKVYPVDSPMGRKVINMTKQFADINRDANRLKSASNRLTQANIAPKALVVPAKGGGGSSQTSSILAGLGGGGNTSVTHGRPRATGNILTDIKNLHAYRKGLTPKPWALNCQKFAVKVLGKVVAPLMALDFYMAMTGPRFNFITMEFEPELSTDGKIEYAAGIFTGLVGASIGATVGAFLGTLAIPIPGIGTLTGGLIGGYVGFLAGDALGRFVARYLMEVRPPKMEHDKMMAIMGKFKAARHTSLANKMIGMNASTQRELGLYGDIGNSRGKTFTATSSLTGQQNNPNTRQALLNPLAAGGISRQLETGGIGTAGTTGAHFTNLAVTPTGDRLNRIDHINSQNNSFMANAMRAFSSAGRDGGGFFNQSNNANDNSTTHHHNYGNNQIRTIEGGGGQNVITDKMIFM